jgi:hypothetical protein
MLYRGESREPASYQFHMLVLSLQSFTFAEVPRKIMRNCVIAYLENIFLKNRIKLDTILGMKSSGLRWSGGRRNFVSLRYFESQWVIWMRSLELLKGSSSPCLKRKFGKK